MTELAATARRVIHSDCPVVDHINRLALLLVREEPMLVLTWAHLLMVCRFDRWSFWQHLLEGDHSTQAALTDSGEGSSRPGGRLQSASAHVSLVHNGAVSLFCQLVVSVWVYVCVLMNLLRDELSSQTAQKPSYCFDEEVGSSKCISSISLP